VMGSKQGLYHSGEINELRPCGEAAWGQPPSAVQPATDQSVHGMIFRHEHAQCIRDH
jgi:hypothetical protein